jgi:hypothetical protein
MLANAAGFATGVGFTGRVPRHDGEDYNSVLPHAWAKSFATQCCKHKRRAGREVSLGTVITVIDVLDAAVVVGQCYAAGLINSGVCKACLPTSTIRWLTNRTTLLALAGIAVLLLVVFRLLFVVSPIWKSCVCAVYQSSGLREGLLAGVFSVRKLENKGPVLLHTAFT